MVHVYLTGEGTGSTKYDNLQVKGESVSTEGKKGRKFDAQRSFGMTTLSGASSSNAAPTYSDWEWDNQYKQYRRYNYTTQAWERQS